MSWPPAASSPPSRPVPSAAEIAANPANGLCDACVHQRLVPNTRGSVFSLCERSRTDPRFRRYPATPVLRCAGFEPRPAPEQRDPAG